jgi:hypothetical protein
MGDQTITSETNTNDLPTDNVLDKWNGWAITRQAEAGMPYTAAKAVVSKLGARFHAVIKCSLDYESARAAMLGYNYSFDPDILLPSGTYFNNTGPYGTEAILTAIDIDLATGISDCTFFLRSPGT